MNITLGEKIWFDHTRALIPEYIRIIGRVVGNVCIKDINRAVAYNTVVDIPASEARMSKDLLNSIHNKWVDVVYGKEYLHGKVSARPINYNDQQSQLQPQQLQPQVVVQQQQPDMTDIKNYVATETQKTMVAIAQVLTEVKRLQPTNVTNVNIDPDSVQTIAQQIIDKLPTKKPETKIEESQNVFINLNEDKDLKTNIEEGRLGVVTTVKGEKIKSVVSKLKNIQTKKGD